MFSNILHLMVKANSIFILFFISPYYAWSSLTSIMLFHLTVGLFDLNQFCVTFSQHIFIMFIPHCKYFFQSSCPQNLAHNAVNTCTHSILHQKCTCTRSVRQMPLGIKRLKNMVMASSHLLYIYIYISQIGPYCVYFYRRVIWNMQVEIIDNIQNTYSLTLTRSLLPLY